MRSLISLTAAALLALMVWPGVDTAAGQSRKKKTPRVAQTATQAADKSKTSSATTKAMPAQAQAPAPIPVIESPDGIARITPASAREAVEKGRAIIVDVRGEDSYNAGHVKGARWINLNEIESRAKDLPRDKMIITYCS